MAMDSSIVRRKKMGSLDRKTAVITGGARGIGRQIAVTFAKEGADIVIGDTGEMEKVAQEIRNLGRRVATVKTDVTKKTDVDILIDTAIHNFGKVDILGCIAGIAQRKGFLEMTEQDWDGVMDVNLKGVFFCAQAVAKYMIERKYGKIIMMGSVAGLGASPGSQLHYGVSKAGVICLAKYCAQELGPYGVNVNAIAPGTIITDMTQAGRTPEQVTAMIAQRRETAVLRRVGSAQDIANLALFLASNESSFITGQVIVSDGGRLGFM
jgi:NAD(P)-dependent dehydrogenase (short-subunit alcohol dehydrogenase family)